MYMVSSDQRGHKKTKDVIADSTTYLASTDLKDSNITPPSASWTAAFYSSTIVPALADNEALSSLITSLASISNEAKLLESKKTIQLHRSQEEVDQEDIISRVAVAPDFQIAASKNEKKIPDDFCPPPVAGYTTSFDLKLPNRLKTSGNDSRLRTKFTKKSPLTIKTTKLPQGLQSPDSSNSAVDLRSSGNESVSSLPLSVNSKLNRTKTPFRMLFSPKLGESPPNEQPLHSNLHKASDATSDNLLPTPTFNDEPELRRISAFVHTEKFAEHDASQSDNRTLSSLSPSLRPDLGENLIPSRRSSLRNGSKRLSSGSKDLKSMNIDQDLIEENDSTVQRIIELQQAREKRQKEWRKEARKSEKAAKRRSLSAQDPGRQSSPARNSWHSRLTEAPVTEEYSIPTPRNSNDGPFGPAVTVENLEKDLTFMDDTSEPLNDLKWDFSLSAPITPSMSGDKKHGKRLSGSIRRSSSMRHNVPDDVKIVSEEVDVHLGSPRLTQRIRHPRTGRTIAFSEVGDPDGFVVICCVGMGMTRYVAAFYDEIARTQKLRIITPDRPAVGETSPMPEERCTPLAWVDDVAVICSSLGIEKFSLLAHSAGAIYALATALKMPQYIRGRIHLLAPWIPSSQLAASQTGNTRALDLPTSHKILSFLPTSFMKAANSKYFNVTSASFEPTSRKQRKGSAFNLAESGTILDEKVPWSTIDMPNAIHTLPTPETSPTMRQDVAFHRKSGQIYSPPISPSPCASPQKQNSSHRPTSSNSLAAHRVMSPHERERFYNTMLTQRTWALATTNGNPAADLVICLERRRPIGFRYTDITRCVVVHHGANDNRVPLENVRWLSSVMKRCELRIIPNEGHGLMANANIISNVLTEVGREWAEWNEIVKRKENEALQQEREEQAQRRSFRKESKGTARR